MFTNKIAKLVLIFPLTLLTTYASATINLGGVVMMGSDGKSIQMNQLQVSNDIISKQVVSNSVVSPTINVGTQTVIQNGKTLSVPSITVNGATVDSNIVVKNNLNVGSSATFSAPAQNGKILVGNFLITADAKGNLTQTQIDPKGSQAVGATVVNLPANVPTVPVSGCLRSLSANAINGTYTITESCPGKAITFTTGLMPKTSNPVAGTSASTSPITSNSLVSAVKLNPAPSTAAANLIKLK